METKPAVVEISSDDEDLSLDKLDSFEWIVDLLDRADVGIEEVDDVMVVDEFSAPPASPKKNSESLRPARGSVGDEVDDDCLVLDFDPDKSVSVDDDKGGGGDGSDDLVIVGERGQLACRDFPHPRHLCINFPFSSTSHEKHCKLCHCYVCDSPAPCMYWGNGGASTDHCHSTDKDGRWKALRETFKQKNITTTQPQKLPDTTLSMMPSLQRSVQNSVPLRWSSLPIQSSRSIPFRPCSAARRATQDPPNHRHHQNLAPLSYRGQRPVHCASKSHPLSPRTQCVERQIKVADTFAAQSVYYHARFKRVGTAHAGPVPVILNENQSPCGVLNNDRFHRNVPQRYHVTPVTSKRSQHPPSTSERSQHSEVMPTQISYSAPVTSQLSQLSPVTSVDDSLNQMHKTAPQKSQCVPVTLQSSQCPPMTPINDDINSWQDILASVASELGVSDSGYATPDVQQPLTVSSQPLSVNQFISETTVNLDVNTYGHSAPEATSLNSLDFDCGWLNPTSQSTPENAWGTEPQLQNVQPSDSIVSWSKQDSAESQLGNHLTTTGEEMVAQAAKEPGQPELDPVTLLFDFETWSDLAQV